MKNMSPANIEEKESPSSAPVQRMWPSVSMTTGEVRPFLTSTKSKPGTRSGLRATPMPGAV